MLLTDNDPQACAWLRELVKAGQLEGDILEQSIADLCGSDLANYRHVHLFAGIGGWPYALQLAGWPAVRPVWTGSCPCQPFSAAGKRKGQADERHLWPVFLRLIRECHPPTVFGEQVSSDDGYRWLARVRDDLEEAGYAVGCADLPACSQGAPHIRQRLFWVAHAKETGRGARRHGGAGERPAHAPGRLRRTRGLADANERAQSRRSEHDAGRGQSGRVSGDAGGLDDAKGNGRNEHQAHARSGECVQTEAHVVRPGDTGFWSDFALVPCRDGKVRRVEPGTFPLAPGLPGRVGLLRGYGNSIVPQVAAAFVRAFLETESMT